MVAEARRDCTDEEWRQVIEELTFTKQHAYRLLAIGLDPRLVTHVLLLPSDTMTLYHLTRLSDDRYDELDGTDWHGKIVAFFGCGDAVGYGDSYVDAFGILWEKMEPLGPALAGKVSVNDYQFNLSRSLVLIT